MVALKIKKWRVYVLYISIWTAQELHILARTPMEMSAHLAIFPLREKFQPAERHSATSCYRDVGRFTSIGPSGTERCLPTARFCGDLRIEGGLRSRTVELPAKQCLAVVS